MSNKNVIYTILTLPTLTHLSGQKKAKKNQHFKSSLSEFSPQTAASLRGL